MSILTPIAIVIVLVVLSWAVWRLVAFPCPTWLAWLLDNPFTSDYQAKVVSRLGLVEGLSVLDAGCGPGRLTIPIARAVGPGGRVLAVDIQAGMISRAMERAAQAGLANVDFLCAPLGSGRLPTTTFDRALLVTVLGEIPDKLAALREIYESLKPGGFLSITEVLPDPDYQPRSRVETLTLQAGFQVSNAFGNPLLFTLNVQRH